MPEKGIPGINISCSLGDKKDRPPEISSPRPQISLVPYPELSHYSQKNSQTSKKYFLKLRLNITYINDDKSAALCLCCGAFSATKADLENLESRVR
ncbi:hypothetical protein ACTXT7_005355 [Hymenolepis weldensis]